MKENDWTKTICSLLNKADLGENVFVETLRKIPYAFEIKSFANDWSVDDKVAATAFETDMIVYEQTVERKIPRVIIESKLGTITSHDAITYSHKAEYHKNVIPHVRYGIMVGDRETYPLPARVFRHGSNFDFLFSFVGLEPTAKEAEVFVEVIKKEIHYSKQIEEILLNNRNPSRKRYFALQKEFHLIEMDD